MSKKTKSSPFLIIIAVVLALCIISILIDYWYISLPIVAICIAIAIYFISKSKKNKAQKNDITDYNSETKVIEKNEKKLTLDVLNNKIDAEILKYKYDEKMYYTSETIPDESLVGKNVEFITEPDNQHDANAVAIYVEGNKLGYVYKGLIQDMLHDWIKKDFTVRACISSVTDTEVRYIIGFYKPVETFKCDIFKLTKTSKKIDEYTKRIDNIQFLNEDDEVTFEWDNESESYVAYNNSYDEIGELPQKANELLDELENYVAVVDECDTIDNISLKIAIYH